MASHSLAMFSGRPGMGVSAWKRTARSPSASTRTPASRAAAGAARDRERSRDSTTAAASTGRPLQKVALGRRLTRQVLGSSIS